MQVQILPRSPTNYFTQNQTKHMSQELELITKEATHFEKCARIANLLASASLIPDHLKMDMKTKQPLPIEQVQGNCFLIANQAFRWGLDPVAVASESYVIGGKLAYQGKLVAAVINTRAGLAGRLTYEYQGKGDDLTVIVSGRFACDDKPSQIAVRLGDVKTNNQMWTSDPKQKLVYTGAIKWARRHCPECILGILTDDDADQIRERGVDARVIRSHAELPAAFTGIKETAESATILDGEPAEDGEGEWK